MYDKDRVEVNKTLNEILEELRKGNNPTPVYHGDSYGGCGYIPNRKDAIIAKYPVSSLIDDLRWVDIGNGKPVNLVRITSDSTGTIHSYSYIIKKAEYKRHDCYGTPYLKITYTDKDCNASFFYCIILDRIPKVGSKNYEPKIVDSRECWYDLNARTFYINETDVRLNTTKESHDEKCVSNDAIIDALMTDLKKTNVALKWKIIRHDNTYKTYDFAINDIQFVEIIDGPNLRMDLIDCNTGAMSYIFIRVDKIYKEGERAPEIIDKRKECWYDTIGKCLYVNDRKETEENPKEDEAAIHIDDKTILSRYKKRPIVLESDASRTMAFVCKKDMILTNPNGEVRANAGDYVVIDKNGYYNPMSKEIFNELYVRADD